ncbi:MAG TPA: cyclopropane-fatty-acyl-phospholipid synthase family protein [Burkholderiales bacterium]|nr:cyclopropane-fatty-acyl-phospholipid synthase family protein [Burkholderiales bacterium]
MLLETRIQRLLENIGRRNALPLRVRLWNGHTVDLAPAPRVAITLPRPSAARYFLKPDLSTLGKAVVEGHIEVEGPVREIIRVGEGLARVAPGTSVPRFWRPRRRHSRRLDADAIAYHYDVSNEFYGLWLDREMVYSCAYFPSGEEDIHTAQARKLDHICRKLMLRPGEKLLDIGCGWGALIRWAARHYGVHATGITLSRNQYDLATERIRADALEGRCRVLLQDYRDHPGEGVYDKIASVGMFEHVGLRNLPGYFGVIRRLLKQGGMVMNHGITAVDADSRWVGLGAGEFIERYVFPHGELPHLSLVVREMSAQGLEVVDVESLRRHYARTCQLWAERLEAAHLDARAMAGERRYRIWLLYLAGCAHAFEHNWVSIHQVLGTRTPADGRSVQPWSRAHLYAGTGTG